MLMPVTIGEDDFGYPLLANLRKSDGLVIENIKCRKTDKGLRLQITQGLGIAIGDEIEVSGSTFTVKHFQVREARLGFPCTYLVYV